MGDAVEISFALAADISVFLSPQRIERQAPQLTNKTRARACADARTATST